MGYVNGKVLMEGHSHPLYSIDRDNLNRLLSVNTPNDDDMVEIARLFIRYEDFPGAKDLKMDMLKILQMWGITKEVLNESRKSNRISCYLCRYGFGDWGICNKSRF